MRELGKLMLGFGVAMVILGGLLLLAGNLSERVPWLGRLPGDISVERANWKVYVPLGTSLLVSIVVSVVLTLVFALFGAALIAVVCAVVALAWAGPLMAASPNIRVAILEGVRTVDVAGGPMMVGDAAGRPIAAEAPASIRATQRQGQVEVLGRSASAVRLVPMIGILKINKREYPGAIEIVPSGENLVVINELPLEDYLAGAVKAEAGDQMPIEMLKAQAIVARTYAAYHRQLNEGKAYHIVASTAHQQYMGQVAGDSPAWRAVRETEGRVMLLGGVLFPAFYHTDSGGYTEDPRVVFGTANMPPLKPVRVDFASQSAHSEWRLDVPLSDLGAALLKHGISVGRVVALEVLERSTSLRVTYIAVRGLKGTATLRGNDLRRLVGYDTLKSTLFAVVVDGPIARFAGRGYGHGVGLDQWRAKTMADLGYDAFQILAYYYPGAVLSSLERR